MVPPIAILGAGPSGLALGRLLEVAGLDYTIFERDESPNFGVAQGGTLDLHAGSGQLALEEAGLLEQFKALARFDGSTKIADSRGKVLVEFGADGPSDRPEIDRKDLRALLLGSVPERRIQWGRRVTQVLKEDSGSMAVHFEDGTAEKGFRLVVGADGAWSKARTLVTSAQPEYTGFYILTSHIRPGNDHYASAEALAGLGNYFAFGPVEGTSMQFTIMRLGDDSYHTGICLRLPADWGSKHPVSTRHALLQEYTKACPDLHKDMITYSDSEFRSWPLYQMPTEALSWKSVPGVTLIGDAAHVTTPFRGEGVNCAMFDSVCLFQKIQKYGMDRLDEAVAEYEQEMFPRAIDLVAGSAENGEMMFAPDAPKNWLEKMGIKSQ